MIDKSLIGKEYPGFSFEVEKGKIRELVQAIGDSNPLYLDEKKAKESGFEEIPAPPTFPTVVLNWGGDLFKMLVTNLNIDVTRLLHGEEEYEYFQPIYAHDILTCKIKIKDVYEKTGRSGVMDFITIEITFDNQKHQTAVIGRSTLIVRR